jgi:hypothetical protein
MKTSQRPPDYSAASPPTLPRRGFLGSLAALVGVPGLAPAEEPESEMIPDPPAPHAPASAIFNLGRHWRITHDGDHWEAEPVARWDVPSIAAAEQPLPVFTKQESFGHQHLIKRFWRPEDVPRCGLCPECGAGTNVVHPELKMCFRLSPTPLAAEDAPLYRWDGADYIAEGGAR